MKEAEEESSGGEDDDEDENIEVNTGEIVIYSVSDKCLRIMPILDSYKLNVIQYSLLFRKGITLIERVLEIFPVPRHDFNKYCVGSQREGFVSPQYRGL